MGVVGLERLDVRREASSPHVSARAPHQMDLRLPSSQRVRIVDGALRCIAHNGVGKTTLDDVAREAGCSRATVYRVFPRGKDGVLAAVVETEVSRVFSALAVRMGQAADVENVLVEGMTEAARRISEHRALAFLLENEPEVVLPHLAFAHMDAVLAASAGFAAPFLGRWMDGEEARRVAEWATRIVISYIACPADDFDMCSPDDVRSLVRMFVVPGIRSVRRPSQIPAGVEASGSSFCNEPKTTKPTFAKGEAS